MVYDTWLLFQDVLDIDAHARFRVASRLKYLATESVVHGAKLERGGERDSTSVFLRRSNYCAFFFVGVGYLLRQSMKIEREASAIMGLANATFALELALLKVQSSDVIIPNCKILV